VSGIRLVIEEFRADVTKTRKDGSKGALRIDYGDGREPQEPLRWLWKYVDGAKTAGEPYRAGLLLTHPRPLAENSPTDFVWGCRDPEGGRGGENLLGLALMRVRAELAADVQSQLAALAPER
jgi:NADAR domain